MGYFSGVLIGTNDTSLTATFSSTGLLSKENFCLDRVLNACITFETLLKKFYYVIKVFILQAILF